jgi:hypothetical protein
MSFWMLSQTLLTLRMILPHEPVGSFRGRSVYPGHVSGVKYPRLCLLFRMELCSSYLLPPEAGHLDQTHHNASLPTLRKCECTRRLYVVGTQH